MFTKIREVKDECPLCEGVRNLVYGSQQEKILVRGEEIDVSVNLFYCPTGDHYFQSFDDDEERIQSAYRGYRKKKGFLQPEEIKQIREQYRLSQRNFARLLGWGDITIHRYETGAIQDEPHNDVLMFIKEFDNFKKYFATKKHSIDPDVASKIENIINKRTFGMLEKLFSAKRSYPLPIQSKTELHYSQHIENSQGCIDNELALAA